MLYQVWIGKAGDPVPCTHACTHQNKNTHVVCQIPKILYGVLLHLFQIHSFSTLLLTLFTTGFIKCSVPLYSTFYLHFFFHKVTFGFSHACYLLNILKRSSNLSASKVLQIFLLFVYITRNAADVTNLYINSLTPIFAKSMFNTLLPVFT